MKQVGILYVHGIHEKGPGFSKRLHDRVERYLIKSSGWTPVFGELVAEEAYWADLFKPIADDLEAKSSGMKTGWNWLRRLMLTTVAQAAGYEDDQGAGTHELVHQRIADALKALEAKTHPTTPVIVVAHSLGTVLMSDYIWDRQHPDGKPRMSPSLMERLVNFQGLVTMGSPLALYAARWDKFGAPINMAGDPHAAPWINIVAKRDVIAWPLKTLNDGYHQEVTEDVLLPTTWDFRTWSPWAHTSYWTSKQTAAIIGEMVKRAWEM